MASAIASVTYINGQYSAEPDWYAMASELTSHEAAFIATQAGLAGGAVSQIRCSEKAGVEMVNAVAMMIGDPKARARLYDKCMRHGVIGKPAIAEKYLRVYLAESNVNTQDSAPKDLPQQQANSESVQPNAQATATAKVIVVNEQMRVRTEKERKLEEEAEEERALMARATNVFGEIDLLLIDTLPNVLRQQTLDLRNKKNLCERDVDLAELLLSDLKNAVAEFKIRAASFCEDWKDGVDARAKQAAELAKKKEADRLKDLKAVRDAERDAREREALLKKLEEFNEAERQKNELLQKLRALGGV